MKYQLIKNKRLSISTIFLVLMLSTSTKAALNIANVPLFITPNLDPNIMFILDDSGSMQWEVMPDESMHFSIYLFPRPSGLYGGSDYINQVPDFLDNNIHNVT